MTTREQMVNAMKILESAKLGSPSPSRLRSQNSLMARIQRQQIKSYNKELEAERKRVADELGLMDKIKNGDLLKDESPFEFHIPSLKKIKWGF